MSKKRHKLIRQIGIAIERARVERPIGIIRQQPKELRTLKVTSILTMHELARMPIEAAQRYLLDEISRQFAAALTRSNMISIEKHIAQDGGIRYDAILQAIVNPAGERREANEGN